MELTKGQFERTVNNFRKLAGEEVKVEFYDSAFWVFGSELATLRLFRLYSYSGDSIRQDYSSNIGSHYFKLETPSFTGEMATE